MKCASVPLLDPVTAERRASSPQKHTRERCPREEERTLRYGDSRAGLARCHHNLGLI